MTLPTDPYKGVRDFYPDDFAFREYIFRTMRDVAHCYGYEEYDASILEPSELYRTKSNEEIVNEQTYTFTDRGDREVTLRPEMTPTLARMVAGKHKELPFPIRWFSIPNVFRYERPQRGRLREHWQLNLDIIGSNSVYAEIEILLAARDLMYAFGAKPEDFEIRVNHRGIIDTLFQDMLGLDDEKRKAIRNIIDKKQKLELDEFERRLKEVLPAGHDIGAVLSCIETHKVKDVAKALPTKLQDCMALKDIENLMQLAESHGIENIVYDGSLMRGFDYYTGLVFEVFDTHPENSRALFGGGRYDNLTEIFGVKDVPAVGFGMGDVRIADFLRVRNLLPEKTAPACVYICVVDSAQRSSALTLADSLRQNKISTIVDITEKKLSDQVRFASKAGVRFVICVGEKEIQTNTYNLKNLATSEERPLDKDALVAYLKEQC